VVPLVILVLVAAIQVVGLARVRMELQAAARDGARVAATTPDPARAVEAVVAALSPDARDRVRVSVERPARAGAPARVTVSIRHSLGVPFASELAVPVTARATMRTEK
jgi:hypothetical protein